VLLKASQAAWTHAATPAPEQTTVRRGGVRLAPADLAQVLRTFAGTRRELAQHLGWTERTLYRRLREAGLS